MSEISTIFSGRSINVIFSNYNHLDYGTYGIKEVSINGAKLTSLPLHSENCIVLNNFKELLNQTHNTLNITLE